MVDAAISLPSAPPLAFIVAVAANGVIGRANGLPWHLSSDLKRFRSLTLGKPVLMGRKTFASIGRVLPGRETIVISRDPGFTPPPGVHLAATIEAALDLAAARAKAMEAQEIMVAGGADIFAALIHRADRLYLTFVAAQPEGDVFLPQIDWSQWREVKREAPAPTAGDEAAFSFVDYLRHRPA